MSKQENNETTEYNTYIDERKELVIGERESSARYDKWILTLAGGSLGLSITFIKNVSPDPETSTLWFLGIAWSLLLLAIIAALASHLTSQSAFRRQRDILDEELEKHSPQEKVNGMATATHWLNIASMALFSTSDVEAASTNPSPNLSHAKAPLAVISFTNSFPLIESPMMVDTF